MFAGVALLRIRKAPLEPTSTDKRSLIRFQNYRPTSVQIISRTINKNANTWLHKKLHLLWFTCRNYQRKRVNSYGPL